MARIDIPVAWGTLALETVAAAAVLYASAYLITRAAAIEEREDENGEQMGFRCLIFGPVLFTIWRIDMTPILGLLPLALGYFLAAKKKPGWAGLAWSILIWKPDYLFVPLCICLVQFIAKKYASLLFLVCGSVLFCLAGHLFGLGWPDLPGLLRTSVEPVLNISFVNGAMMAKTPPNLDSFMYVIALMIAIGGFRQLNNLARTEDKDRELLPFSALVGTFLPMLLCPALAYKDLTVMVMAGLIAYCYEWREHIEWRIHSLVRTAWLCINAYIIVFYAAPAFAIPIILAALLTVFYLRLAETVRFVSHTPAA